MHRVPVSSDHDKRQVSDLGKSHTSHASQTVAPGVLEYLPVAHASQLDASIVLEYFPARHCMQVPPALYVPAAHCPVLILGGIETNKEPNRHPYLQLTTLGRIRTGGSIEGRLISDGKGWYQCPVGWVLGTPNFQHGRG